MIPRFFRSPWILPPASAAFVALLLAGGCASNRSESTLQAPVMTDTEAVETPSPVSEPVEPPERIPGQNAPVDTGDVQYNLVYDEDLEMIFDLAEKGKWEEAEMQAFRLLEMAPNDPTILRVQSWVTTQRQQQRDRAVENKIREIDSQNSVFNPTVKSLLTENKDRGLPPRKDLRDAVEQIEATPYVPSSYGRLTEHEGLPVNSSVLEGPMAELLNRRISVQLDDVTLEEIIFQVGEAESINIVADKNIPAFQSKLSVNFENVQLKEFLDYISRNLQVNFQIGEDLIWILDGKEPTNLKEETRIYRLREGFVMPARFADETPTRVETRNKDVVTTQITEQLNLFVPDLAPEKPAIEQAIEKFFKGSAYQFNYERNLIIATGTREQLEVLERIIQEFDQPIQQVLIEAKFITVSEPAFLRLGVAWETGRNLLTQEAIQPEDFTRLAPANVSLPIQETFTNILGRENLSATLTALNQSGESQTLSSPRLTLINNRPATISDGKIQYYYEQYTVKQTAFERGTTSSLVPDGKPTKITSGVELDVVASIGGDGETILLALNPRVSQDVQLVTFATITDVDETGRPVSTFEIKLPEARTQELATRVSVRSGETVVMGGVIERNQTTFVESVPVLGNLPLVGSLFRRRTEVDAPRYLLIFVTATIVSESGEFVLPREVQ